MRLHTLSLSRDFDIGPLKNVSTSLTFSRINWEDDNQDQLYLNISIPWGTSRTLSYGMQRNQDNKNPTVRNATWEIGQTKSGALEGAINFGHGPAAGPQFRNLHLTRAQPVVLLGLDARGRER